MRNGKFSYQIKELVRSVYDIWEIDNSYIKNEKLKMKSLIKQIEMLILYFIQHFYSGSMNVEYEWKFFKHNLFCLVV